MHASSNASSSDRACSAPAVPHVRHHQPQQLYQQQQNLSKQLITATTAALPAPAVPHVRHHQPLPQQHRGDGGAAVVPLVLRIQLQVLPVCFLRTNSQLEQLWEMWHVHRCAGGGCIQLHTHTRCSLTSHCPAIALARSSGVLLSRAPPSMPAHLVCILHRARQVAAKVLVPKQVFEQVVPHKLGCHGAAVPASGWGVVFGAQKTQTANTEGVHVHTAAALSACGGALLASKTLVRSRHMHPPSPLRSTPSTHPSNTPKAPTSWPSSSLWKAQ